MEYPTNENLKKEYLELSKKISNLRNVTSQNNDIFFQNDLISKKNGISLLIYELQDSEGFVSCFHDDVNTIDTVKLSKQLVTLLNLPVDDDSLVCLPKIQVDLQLPHLIDLDNLKQIYKDMDKLNTIKN